MTYGIRIKNSSGEIQIDGEYRNLAFTEDDSDVAISNDNTDGGHATSIAITSNSLVPLILMRPDTDQFVTIITYLKSNGNYTNFKVTTSFSQSTKIDWRCYRQTVTVSSGYGLRIKDALGAAVFHSFDNHFKIYSIHDIDLAAPDFESFPYEDISHPDISDPYYILTPVGLWVTDWAGPFPPSPPGYFRWELCKIGIKKLSSTSVRVGWFAFGALAIPGSPPGGVNEGWNPTAKLIVCKI